MKNKNKAIFCMLLAAFGFAMMSVFVKLAGDLPSVQKSFFRNIVSLVVALFLIIKARESFIGKKENRKYLFGRALCGTLGILANYYAIDNMILSDANMLNKLSPFVVIICSYIFLKEKINKGQIIALIIAFSGVLFIVKPEFGLTMIPALVGIASALFAGMAYTFVRFLGGKEKAPTIVFTFSAFSCLFTLPFILFDYVPMTLEQLILLLLAGIFASISQFAITAAYKYAPAKEVSIYDYSQIIFAAVLGYLFFGQLPDFMSLMGYVLIIGSSIGMYFYNLRTSH